MPDFLHLVYLVPLFPLLAFALIVFFTNPNKQLSSTIAIAAIGLSWLVSWGILGQALAPDPVGGKDFKPVSLAIPFLPTGATTFSLGVMVDALTAAMLFMVPFVCLMIFIYARGYMNPPDLHTDPRYSRFFAYISLFACGMLALVVADNLLLLFIAWEIMGLCSYLLIGFWYEKPSAMNAAKKAFLTTRVGDVLLFLGMLLLYGQTGTLTFADIFKANVIEKLAHTEYLWGFSAATVAALLIFAGAIGKSAQFPLHVWLPDAMEGPTPVSALIHAATMVAAGVYLVARTMPVFAASGLEGSQALLVVGAIGGFTALFASTIAVAQNDIKRVLAYSTISQLGYMVMALGLGGFVAAIFHLLTHAFFKALLFLGSGSVIIGMERGHHFAEAGHGGGHQADAHPAPFDPNDMMNMGGLMSRMPHTFWTYLVGSLALAGIIPLAGFWSKDEILAHAFEGFMKEGVISLPFVAWGLGTLAAFFTAFYMGRQLGLVFWGQPRHAAADKAKESPATMTVPLMVLAVFTLVLGLINLPPNLGLSFGGFLHDFIGEVFQAAHLEFEATPFNFIVAGISTALALAGLGAGWMLYRNLPAGAPDPLAKLPGYHFLKNKWYVDEFYNKTFVALTYALSTLSGRFDRAVIDGTVNTIGEAGRAMAMDLKDYFDTLVIEGAVNGAGRLSVGAGQYLRGIQTGRAQNYLLVVSLSVIVLGGYRLVGGSWELMLFGLVVLSLVAFGAYVFSKATR
ncbi:MAG: NADH-quinone oxidoreductase subunit L [Chloroflexi bacterium]|nr:NADH-quinone oxidoreductase subunit L [Chloroflexota bacterium]